MPDVLLIGEALLRLTPPDYKRIEQSTHFEWHIGGSELNTAVGLARLGCDVSWVSRLTDNVIGKLIAQTLRAQTVDISQVVWTDNYRIGTYYMEEGIGSRPSQVTYDRADSSMSTMTPQDIELDAIFADRPQLFHTTGITMALSASTAQIVRDMVFFCQKHEIPVSFDFNYRAKLWDIETARQQCQTVLDIANLIFIPARDAWLAYSTDELAILHKHFPQATVVMTRGEDGAIAVTPDGQIFEQHIFPTETVCRIGGGDAFAAGFLFGVLNKMDTQTCLRYGTALASLKYSLAGDMPLVTLKDVEILTRNHTNNILR